jgi:hypothetical protein
MTKAERWTKKVHRSTLKSNSRHHGLAAIQVLQPYRIVNLLEPCLRAGPSTNNRSDEGSSTAPVYAMSKPLIFGQKFSLMLPAEILHRKSITFYVFIGRYRNRSKTRLLRERGYAGQQGPMLKQAIPS